MSPAPFRQNKKPETKLNNKGDVHHQDTKSPSKAKTKTLV
jgi:hypothetical protein